MRLCKKLLLGGALVALSGCANWQQTTTDIIDTAYIIEVNESISQTVLKANLTEAEQSIVQQAEDEMVALKEYLKGITDNPSKIVLLDKAIEVSASKYREAKLVVLNHEDEYLEYDWEGLAALDARLTEMYERYQDFKKQQDYANAVTQLGEYAKLAAKLAILYGA